MSGDTATAAPNENPEVPASGLFGRLSAIFFEPGKVFEEIKRRPTWLGIFVVLALVAIAGQYVAVTRVDYETYMRQAFAKSPFTKNMPEDQIQQILSRPRSAFQKYMQVTLAPVIPLIISLVFAAVFLLAFVLMGASLTYRKALAVTFWAMAPPGIILTLLAIVFMLVKEPDSLDVIDITRNVASNPAMAVDEKTNPILHSLLDRIDLFSFWTIYLLCLGFATVAEIKLGKAAAVIGVLWVLYALVRVGISVLMA
jgi:Yip1 domain